VSPYFFDENFLLHTEGETGKIKKKFCGVDLLKLKKKKKMETSKLRLELSGGWSYRI